jgi:hypothetical protein
MLQKGFIMLIGQKMLGSGIFKYANKYWSTSKIISESIFTSIQEHMSVFWIYQRTQIFFYFYFFLHHNSMFYSSMAEKYATPCTQIPSIFLFRLLPALSSLPVLGLIILLGVYSHVSFLIVINPQAISVNTYRLH